MNRISRLLIASGIALFIFASFAAAHDMEHPQGYEPLGLDRAYTPPFKVIDSHTHFSVGTADSIAAHMEEWGLAKMVVLQLPQDNIDELVAEFGRYPDKFAVLATIDFSGVDEKGWKKNLEQQVRHAHEVGAAGIKLYKDFSVYLKDKKGNLIPVDDPRYDPLWKTAGELGMPVLVHVGDPERFWMPIDSQANFIEKDEWAFHNTGVPFREAIVRQLENVIRKFPGTTFVGAHVGNRSEEPMVVAYLLDTYPNYYVDLAARFGELSKDMRATRWLLMEHADRVMFATDWGVWAQDGFPANWAEDAARFYSRAHRIVWTRDHEIPTPFDGNEGPILVETHRWACDGWAIPEATLKQVCRDTALKVFFKE